MSRGLLDSQRSAGMLGARRWALLFAIAAFLCGVGVGRAAEMKASKPEVRKEIGEVIEAQLAAFRKGDGKKAYGYASAELRAQKPQPVFLQIVQINYPEVWASTRAELGIVRDDGARAAVTVHVYSKNGDAAYDYTLAKEKAGWRVHGVLRHAGSGKKV